MKTRRCINILIFLFLQAFAYSQSANVYYTHHLEEEGEAVSSALTNIFTQDSYGYLWMNEKTIAKYNLKNLKVFNKFSFNALNAEVPYVYCLQEDSEGKIWLATNQGLFLYQRELDNFKLIDFAEFEIKQPVINRIKIDLEDNLWLATRSNGLLCYNSKTKEITKYPNPLIDEQENIISIVIDKSNNIWLSYDKKGVYVLSKTSEGIYQFHNHPHSRITTRNNSDEIVKTEFWPDKLIIDKEGKKWAFYKKHIYIWNSNGYYFESFSDYFKIQNIDRTTSIHDFKIENNGKVWFITDHGLNSYSVGNTNAIHYKVLPLDETRKTINPSEFTNLFIDKFNVLWIQVFLKGYITINLNNIKDDVFSLQKLNPPYSPEVYDIIEIKNNLWVGGLSCVMKLNKNFNKANTIDLTSYLPYHYNIGNLVFIEKNNTLWFSALHGDIYFSLDILTGKISKYKLPSGSEITALIKDHNNQIWITTLNNGLFLINPLNNGRIITSNAYNVTIKDKQFSTAFCNPQGIIHFGNTRTGLWKVLKNGNIENYHHIPNNPHSLPSNYIKAITEDQNGDLWIGTEFEGVCKKSNQKFICFSTENGLADNMVQDIIIDDLGTIWISTIKGLTSISKNGSTIKTYTSKIGLPCESFLPNAAYKCSNGTLLFGTTEGLLSFKPMNLSPNEQEPIINIVDIQANGKSIHSGDTYKKRIILENTVETSKTINIPHSWKNIKIEYNAIQTASYGKIKYQYYLEGFDKKWIYADENTFTSYTNLNPGKYYFHVIACNSDNIWNKKEKTICINIFPPFYLRVWFKITFFIVLALSIWLIIFLRINNLKKQREILEQKVSERTLLLTKANNTLSNQKDEIIAQAEELTSQSQYLASINADLKDLNQRKDRLISIIGHDLRNPFYAIKGLAELLVKHLDNMDRDRLFLSVSTIDSTASHATDLLENILTWARSQHDINNIKKEPVEINELIKLCFNLQKLSAEAKNINLVLSNDSKLEISIDKNMIQTVIRNLLNNSIKFTPDNGTIQVNYFINDEQFIIEIKDNGIGMPEKILNSLFKIDDTQRQAGTNGEKGTGLGLLICHEFIKAHNGKILAESNVNKGSIFTISIPQ